MLYICGADGEGLRECMLGACPTRLDRVVGDQGRRWRVDGKLHLNPCVNGGREGLRDKSCMLSVLRRV